MDLSMMESPVTVKAFRYHQCLQDSMQQDSVKDSFQDSLLFMTDCTRELFDFDDSLCRTLESCEQSCDLEAAFLANQKPEVHDIIKSAVSALLFPESPQANSATTPQRPVLGQRPPCYGKESSPMRTHVSSQPIKTSKTQEICRESAKTQPKPKTKSLLHKLKVILRKQIKLKSSIKIKHTAM